MMRRRTPTARREKPSGVRVLVTGFGPFPGTPVNVSAQLIRGLGAGRTRGTGGGAVIIKTAVLRTAWRFAFASSDRAARGFRPDVIIQFGVSRQATAFTLERFAHNACALSPDCRGDVPRQARLAHAGLTIETNAPCTAFARALTNAGFAADMSDDAGRYLCNAVYFESLRTYRSSQVDVIFVHIPATAECGAPMALCGPPAIWYAERAC